MLRSGEAGVKSEGGIFKIVCTLELHSARTLWSQLLNMLNIKLAYSEQATLPPLL